jgi:hypothetical protein
MSGTIAACHRNNSSAAKLLSSSATPGLRCGAALGGHTDFSQRYRRPTAKNVRIFCGRRS